MNQKKEVPSSYDLIPGPSLHQKVIFPDFSDDLFQLFSATEGLERDQSPRRAAIVTVRVLVHEVPLAKLADREISFHARLDPTNDFPQPNLGRRAGRRRGQRRFERQAERHHLRDGGRHIDREVPIQERHVRAEVVGQEPGSQAGASHRKAGVNTVEADVELDAARARLIEGRTDLTGRIHQRIGPTVIDVGDDVPGAEEGKDLLEAGWTRGDVDHHREPGPLRHLPPLAQGCKGCEARIHAHLDAHEDVAVLLHNLDGRGHVEQPVVVVLEKRHTRRPDRNHADRRNVQEGEDPDVRGLNYVLAKRLEVHRATAPPVHERRGPSARCHFLGVDAQDLPLPETMEVEVDETRQQELASAILHRLTVPGDERGADIEDLPVADTNIPSLKA